MNNLITLTLDDQRRLTGKSLLWNKPGAIIDAFVSGIDKQTVVDQWLIYVNQLLAAVDWQDESTCYRIFEDGISLAISAPMDALYASCDVNEAAWDFACSKILTGSISDTHQQEMDKTVTRLKQMIAEEANPALLNLIDLAINNHVDYLVDDDEFSLGYGKSCQRWPVTSLPDPTQLNWHQYQSIPIALVTGTNGKSTTVRIMSEIIKQSNKCCGVTSTDFIRVGEKIIDYGDYSGPGGARMLLRHPETETAILEVARGGILRRGLPIDHVDAALITNIAEDHLGQYGINTVAGLAQTKAVVAKALTSGVLVLNADDPYLTALAPTLTVNKCWFSLNENNPVLQQHKAIGGAICFIRDGAIFYCTQNTSTGERLESMIVAVNDIPMTLNGAARHNVQNALGATALAKSLHIDSAVIGLALQNFSSNVDDNPGRGNQFKLNGASVIMDFAHNVHGMNAMALTMANIPASRKFLMLSHAGDRSNDDIIKMTKSALKMKPDILVAAETVEYLRGRELGEISNLIAKVAIESGMSADNIYFSEGPYQGAQQIVNQLSANDLALLIVLSERNKVIELLTKKANQTAGMS
ncbi:MULTISPECIES: Mur ligase family protein [unclassified Colwellia]|uniref:Mur ligase family protein n=1 Tax=unclassified Colwellia TaxID=196834 RepID=UPI0015F5F20A|nr:MULTISPECIES: Mur ligase family protein [unclassified Colwellia]MBA6362277.1 Mur ligase [Colwellia sp. BRX8-8]MBA6354613.1 Mur ligase [Colwellia sp. BRX8-3]MBA6358974.1 Mur ligase [Colwellia sp. BRX8-6]MBA6366600.1 Mur ligase [Colwellia sp. BRX8-5]MBA6370871.1 Mur ligase [Colwellia sp. BRX8-4]